MPYVVGKKIKQFTNVTRRPSDLAGIQMTFIEGVLKEFLKACFLLTKVGQLEKN